MIDPNAWAAAWNAHYAAERFSRAMRDLENVGMTDMEERTQTAKVLIQKAADEIQQKREESITALEAVWPEPGGDPLEYLRGPFTGLIGPLGLDTSAS